MTLDGKTAFVSGSGHNIGRAIVLEFAGRGANVVVNGLTDPASAEKVADEARSLGVGAAVATSTRLSSMPPPMSRRLRLPSTCP